ncbi:AMP-binding protein [Pseudooceanicola nanhaiensis]|uniref:AMP-binding protein n=1 Tax=Pseudooceanicola nanhaiensis TaxID=375761 RepID=UPI001CD7CCBB|nr:AMP-binding protein [Pseudooceanicola nanhaiensis]MCA0920131.1 AMP-binding protein [Pseudooceanicola nanhaiensis]
MTLLIHDRILQAADAAPGAEALRFLPNGEEVGARLSYGALAAQGLQLARALARRGLTGRPVALLLDPGPELPVALLGLFRAGAIATPLPMPVGAGPLRRVESALAALRPAAILCAPSVAQHPALRRAGVPCLTVAELLAEARDSGSPDGPAPDAPAVIQFSSGSTAEPRGIVLSHANVAANLAMIRDCSGAGPGTVTVTWLPHSHDMGLFGTLLTPLFAGATMVQMPPNAFLRRPYRWLKALSDHRANYTAAPDFGYALSLRRLSPALCEGLDLSALSSAFIGAEPTRMSTVEAFSTALAPAGFRRSALVSCYGLAEATLLCSAGPALPAGRHATCGSAVPGVRLTLRPTPLSPVPGTGEVLVGGPHVAIGLWRGATQDHAPFPEEVIDAGGHRMVPTGDLGRIEDGQLQILDRLKDTLALRGGTIGPAEIEAEARATDPRITAAAAVPAPETPAGTPSADVALAIEIDSRRLVPGAEDEITRAVAARLAAAFGLQVSLHPFAPWKLPRTTSGKIRRFAVRDLIRATAAPTGRAPARVSPDPESFAEAGVISPLTVMTPEATDEVLGVVQRLARLRGELPPVLRAKPHLLVPELWDLVHAPAVVDPVRRILGPDVLCFGTSMIWKPSARDLHVSWHQDSTHWGLETPEAVTAWLALTPSTRANGCVLVAPGTHRSVVPHDHPEDALNMLGRKEVARAEIAPEQTVALELAPGQMSIHHSLVLHGSEPNRSGGDRIGFAMRFIPAGNGQRDGRRGTATLVCGKSHDRYELEVGPEKLMAPEALRRHAHILRRGHEIIYGS